MKNQSKTGSENGFRLIREPGEISTQKYRADMGTKMFLASKLKKKGRKK
jgi:hypothetical protein